MIIVTIGVIAYLLVGFVLLATFGWCLGCPHPRGFKEKFKANMLFASVVVGYPFWILGMIFGLIK